MRHRARRMPSRYQAVAELPGAISRVHVVDVSQGGARLAGTGPLAPGTRCALRVLGDALTAKVVWSEEDRAGIAFDLPLTPRQLNTLRQAGTSAPPGRAPRRQFSFAEMR